MDIAVGGEWGKGDTVQVRENVLHMKKEKSWKNTHRRDIH